MDIGARIRALREAKGYTVNRLANLAGVSQSYLRDVELGNKNPTVNIVADLCWALGISLQEFFAPGTENAFLGEDLQRAMYRLTPAQRQALLTFLESLDDK